MKATGTRRPVQLADLNLKRIERALKARKRYRYVKPRVSALDNGYQVTSPCCSRNIDKDGGVIDVALLVRDPYDQTWQLYRKNHGNSTWELNSRHNDLSDLLERLNGDPERKFWQ